MIHLRHPLPLQKGLRIRIDERAEFDVGTTIAERNFGQGGGRVRAVCDRQIRVYVFVRALRKERTQRGTSRRRKRNHVGGLRSLLPLLLIRAEEEGAIFFEGPAKRAGKPLIGAGQWTASALDIGNQRFGVGNRIEARGFDQVGQRAVQLVRAGFGDRVDDRATCAPEFCVVVRRLDSDFLHAVGVLDLKALTRDRDVVVFRAVNQEVVGASARTVNRKGRATGAITIRRNARQRQRQRNRIARGKRQFRDLGGTDIATAHRSFGLQRRTGFRCDVHRDFLCAGRERRVHLGNLVRADGDVVFRNCAEAIGGDAHRIGAEINGIEAIQPFTISDGRTAHACFNIRKRDGCARNHGSGGVGDNAADRAATGLGSSDKCKAQQQD